MVIRIIDVAGSADTAAQGNLVYPHLHLALQTRCSETVVSFEGIQTATSSFVNVSFVKLLDDWPLAEIKRRFRVVQSTRQINEMIKSRLAREASALA